MLRKALATALVGAAAIGLWSQPAFGKGKPAPTTQESPAARARHAFASDGDDSLYLFGGVSYADGVRFFNDLWYYKVATHKWTEIKPAGGRSTKAPGGRTFAGWSCSGNECVLDGGYYSGGAFADSWVFTVSTGAWSKLDCGLGACPPARYGAAQAYDRDNSSHVLFGGRDASTPPHTALGDTYTFAAGVWTPHGPSSAPSPRSYAGATFVPGKGVAMFGGLGDTRISTQDAHLGDLWLWDGSNWQKVAQTGGPRLSRPSIAWVSSDPRDLRLVVVGGYLSDNSWNQDTWYFRFKPGATLEGTWQEVDGHGPCQSSGGASTDIYPESMMALDIATQTQVFFGGTDPLTELQVGSTVECY